MDTNTVNLLIQQLIQNRTGSDGKIPLLVIGMIIAAIAPTLAAVATYIQSRAALANTQKSKEVAENTANEVGKIHVAVNSERSALLEEVRKLRDEILVISKEKATLVETARVQSVSQAAPVTIPVPVTIISPDPLPVKVTKP